MLRYNYMDIEKKIMKNVDLASLSTFKIGGPAEFYLEAQDGKDIKAAFDWAHFYNYKITVLGGGSNILINDEGIKDLVLRLIKDNFNLKDNKVICGGAVSLNKIARTTAREGLSGLEWGVGIPRAQIAGAIVGNAGAFGFKISDILEEAEVFDLVEGNWKKFKNKDCQFGYRTSVFKEHKRYIISNAVLVFKKEDSKKVGEKMEKIFEFRKDNQLDHPSAGSIFKNIDWEYLQERSPKLAKRAEMEKIVKNNWVSAGWIIEQMGLKGKTMGGAQISLEHGNFIINKKNATALDVIGLISYVKQQVRNEFNIQMQEEIEYLGF